MAGPGGREVSEKRASKDWPRPRPPIWEKEGQFEHSKIQNCRHSDSNRHVMRVLIISEPIEWSQRFDTSRNAPPYDVELDTANINDSDGFQASPFDYDVTIFHIVKPTHHSIGYFENLPKFLQDARLALKNGRTIICLPDSPTFKPQRLQEIGPNVYHWLKQLGIELQENRGSDIRAVGAGRAQVIGDYLKTVREYHQIVIDPETEPSTRLAVVNGTQIVVGLEHRVDNGNLVILPPADLRKPSYFLSMMALMDVARRYYEHGQRHVHAGEPPEWISDYMVPEAIELDDQVVQLQEKKSEFDRLAYVLYGTGPELEASVALLLAQIGLIVEPTYPGANVDLTANHASLGLSFSVEITGSTGTIRKDSSKISQAWQSIQERAGTSEEADRLLIVANTELHLDPDQRKKNSFSREVVQLLGNNGVLLITTAQLYALRKSVHEGNGSADDVVRELHRQSGLFDPNSSSTAP